MTRDDHLAGVLRQLLEAVCPIASSESSRAGDRAERRQTRRRGELLVVDKSSMTVSARSPFTELATCSDHPGDDRSAMVRGPNRARADIVAAHASFPPMQRGRTSELSRAPRPHPPCERHDAGSPESACPPDLTLGRRLPLERRHVLPRFTHTRPQESIERRKAFVGGSADDHHH